MKCLTDAREPPVFEQVSLVKLGPGEHEPQLAAPERAVVRLKRVDPDLRSAVGVARVKVRRPRPGVVAGDRRARLLDAPPTCARLLSARSRRQPDPEVWCGRAGIPVTRAGAEAPAGRGPGRLTPGAIRAAWPRQLPPSAVPAARRLPLISSRTKLTNPRRTSTSDTFSSRLWPASVSFRGGG